MHAKVDDHNTVNNPHNRDGGDYMELREPIEENPFPAFHGDKVGLNSQEGKPPSFAHT